MSSVPPNVDEIWRLFRETDRKFQKTNRRIQETNRLIKLSLERTQSQHEVVLEIKRVSRLIDRLGNRLGDFVEEAVRPAAVRLFRERRIAVHEVHRHVEAQRGNEGIEVDLLVVNDHDVIAIERKSHLFVDDVKEHVERLGKLKRLLPSYANKRVMGAVAAMVIPDNVAQYDYHQGLY